VNERIKELRKSLGLTQLEFGEQVGVKANTIGNYEIGLRTPSDAVIRAICREFNVNEDWLRTGEGEMFNPQDEKLAAFVGSLVADDSDPFKRRMVELLADLTPEEWKLLEKMAERLTKKEEGSA
jgi:transcriptional regulator with XRE-family HTH domain